MADINDIKPVKAQTDKKDDILKAATMDYLDSIEPDNPPQPWEVRRDLLNSIEFEFECQHNALVKKERKWKIPDALPVPVIADVILKLEPVRNVRYLPSEKNKYDLMLYQADGEDKGLYVGGNDVERRVLRRMVREYGYQLSTKDVDEVLTVVEERAPVCDLTASVSPWLIPVNNGIFNKKEKTFMEFSPDYVYLSKCAVDYNPAATENPVIHNDEDGTDWDIESWMEEVTSPGIKPLLWQILSAALCHDKSYDKLILLYDGKGCNGKGTFTQLIRSLIGICNVAPINVAKFSEQFGLEDLPNKIVVLADENDVGAFYGSIDKLKSAVTGDTLNITRKHKISIQYVYKGLIVQCINELPRTADKSDSWNRRLLPVPFPKSFTGGERKYIKHDYMKRRDVLEYAAYKALNMDFKEFDEPFECRQLMEEYRANNDPVRQFVAEIIDELAWDFIPFKFLYDLFVGWCKATNSDGRTLSEHKFKPRLTGVLTGSDSPYATSWEVVAKTVRPGTRMDKPEHLIAEYKLDAWKNLRYRGSDPDQICRPCLKPTYTGGLMRRLPPQQVQP